MEQAITALFANGALFPVIVFGGNLLMAFAVIYMFFKLGGSFFTSITDTNKQISVTLSEISATLEQIVHRLEDVEDAVEDVKKKLAL